MDYVSAFDEGFLRTVEAKIAAAGDVLVEFRFPYAAGDKSYEIFDDIERCMARIKEVRSQTWIMVYNDPQLPFRARVDEAFVAHAMAHHKDGDDWVITCLDKVSMGRRSWYHNYPTNSSADLEEELRDDLCWGKRVACGPEPGWINGDVLHAKVPAEDGTLRPAAY